MPPSPRILRRRSPVLTGLVTTAGALVMVGALVSAASPAPARTPGASGRTAWTTGSAASHSAASSGGSSARPSVQPSSARSGVPGTPSGPSSPGSTAVPPPSANGLKLPAVGAPSPATTALPAMSAAHSPTPSPATSTGTVARPVLSVPVSTGCGGVPIAKAGGGYWTCAFDDEFDGAGLDPTHWTAWNGINYNSSPNTCYYSDPGHVWVRNGYLNLAVTKLVSPQPCWTAYGWQNSQYGGAVVHSKDKFSQTGGRFEARIKFAGGTGLHDAFWLWPQYDKQLYPGHAEIDIAEPYGALPDTMFGAVHLNGTGKDDDGTVRSCSLPNWPGGFHTYAIEWTAGKDITFYFDKAKCFTFSGWTALPGYPDSAPFDQPFFMILQTLADNGSFSPAPDATTVFPAVTQVDWVRVWK